MNPDEYLGPMLADDIASHIRRYIVMDDDQADTVALWVLHCWTIDAFFTTGRLYINSPEHECGKTRLLGTIRRLLDGKRVIQSSSITAATLYRKLENATPTFLIDEADGTIGSKAAKESESQQNLLAILNGGYTRGDNTIPRYNTKTGQIDEYPTFCPVAVAGITGANLYTPAFMSRTIPIDLRRKLRHEEADRWIDGPELRADFDALRDRIETWATLHVEALRVRRIDYPEELSDRQTEIWKPMIAIADQLGGDWPNRCRGAYLRIASNQTIEADSAAHRLLFDIREVLEDREWMASKALVEALKRQEDTDYDTWKPNGLTEKLLAMKLGGYRISPLRRQIEGEEHRGYRRDQFEDAWARYAPSNPGDSGPPTLFSPSSSTSGDPVENTRAPSPDHGFESPDGNGQSPHPQPATSFEHVATRPPRSGDSPSSNGDSGFTDADYEEWAREHGEEPV